MPRLLRYVAALLLLNVAASTLAQSPKNSVTFHITELSREAVDGNEEVVWLATHESARGVARFQISILLKRPSDETPFPFSKGSFKRVDGSRPDELVRQLTVALSARKASDAQSKVRTLPFDVVFLGFELSRAGGKGRISGGAFSAKPPGTWIATKIFLAGGKGQVFFNLDPVSGLGEFSLKDEDYGDIVVNELAKVF